MGNASGLIGGALAGFGQGLTQVAGLEMQNQREQLALRRQEALLDYRDRLDQEREIAKEERAAGREETWKPTGKKRGDFTELGSTKGDMKWVGPSAARAPDDGQSPKEMSQAIYKELIGQQENITGERLYTEAQAREIARQQTGIDPLTGAAGPVVSGPSSAKIDAASMGSDPRAREIQRRYQAKQITREQAMQELKGLYP